MRSILRVISLVLVLGVPALAHAGDSDDTVFLKNGGRVRGTVLVEDPGKGVTIKLADGTTRTVPAADVKNVEYAPVGGAAAPAPAPAPVPAPAPAPAPAGYAPAPAGAPAPAPVAGAPAPVGAAPPPAPYAVSALPPPLPPAEPTYHRRKGMLITGIILMGAGAVFTGIGGGMMLAADGSSSSCYYNGSYTSCYPSTDHDLYDAGVAVAVGGGIAFAAGVPFFIIGLIKVKDDPGANSGKITLVPGRVALAPVATHNTWGLQLSGNL